MGTDFSPQETVQTALGKRLLLGVNIDHVATLRQARGTRYPDPVQAAFMAEQAGADAITLHLREDRRHIQDRDVQLLRETLQTRMNLEMAITADIIDFACRTGPHDCCLVPERREELTTEGGLDVAGQIDNVASACRQLSSAGIRVALFIDPERKQVEAARAAGAPVIELHTGAYADAGNGPSRLAELSRIREAAAVGAGLGLAVHAGHGLNYHNVLPIAEIQQVSELNIGHSIVARAVFTGLTEAVLEMRRLLNSAARG